MRIILFLTAALSLSTQLKAAPSTENSLQAILDKSCQAGACVEGYNLKFRQVTYEPGRQQTTLTLSLVPHAGIDYPILDERFEAQMTQSSFTAVCRVKNVSKESFEALSRGETNEGVEEFRSNLKACAAALSARTERALGR